MDQRILELLDDHDWEPTITRLAAYVVMLCRYHRYRLPAHMQPEDLVIEAIEKVYSGDRNWDPSRDKNLGAFMASVIKSMFTNLMGSKQLSTMGLDSVSISDPNQSDHEIEYEELNNRIAEAVRLKPELAIVFKALKDGLQPIEIAKEYSLDISIVNNAQKKLRRLVMTLVDDN